MDLAGVMALVRGVNPYYVDMFTWRQNGNVVKAYPKLPISEAAFNAVKRVFRSLGGKFVSWRGQLYFELVVLEECCLRKGSGFLSPQGNGSGPLFLPAISPAPGTLKQIEAKIASLVRAGHELLEEA